jgi:hypothetical protein
MGLLIGLTLFSSEFTKKTTRKDKAQQETAYGDCIQLIDTLIEGACKLQQQLADLTGQLYKKLRLCALEEKPELARKETHELRNMEKTLKALSNQLQELETALNATEKLL